MIAGMARSYRRKGPCIMPTLQVEIKQKITDIDLILDILTREVASYAVPVVDLMEIGAGGGSIARATRLGTLQVGPQSAGAEPGPICYGRGGEEPTVTDADLLLGYLDPDYFLGGAMQLDAGAARRGIEERVASPLGLSVTQAAWGIVSCSFSLCSARRR